MCGYFCIGFLDFMLESKILLDYINLFCPNEYKENDRIKLEYFQYLKRLRWKKSIGLFAVSIENLKTLKYHTFLKKLLIPSIICSKCENENEKLFKAEELIEIFKILGLIKSI